MAQSPASRSSRLISSLLAALAVAAGGAGANAAHTPGPAAVTVAGSLQDELGCPGDWQPDCAATHLTYDLEDGVWQGAFDVPAGAWEYKAPLDDSWDENYGLNATLNGPNVPLTLGAGQAVKFYYDHATHWITDGSGWTIATAPGSFQSELGCASDWDPSCLRSWLQDPDGDGLYAFSTRALPAGAYEVKVAIAESWTENYGEGGVPGGANIPFTVPSDCAEMLFVYDPVTHILAVAAAAGAAQPGAITVAGSLQDELGCAGDWLADCAATHLAFDTEDGVWQQSFAVPAGTWEYKATVDDSWAENYGLNATRDGANIPLSLAAPTAVKFYYDHATHWITDPEGSTIATAPGSFQSELGCASDWDPSCLRSWLQDPDGDGLYAFSSRLPAGDYEVKVTIDEGWDENYGEGGVPGGANIPFSVATACSEVFFRYDAASHLLTVSQSGAPRGNLRLAQAHWVAADTLAWDVAAGAGEVVRLHFSPTADLVLDASGVGGGESILLTHDPAGLPQEIRDRFPHLAGHAAFKLAAADLPRVPEILQGQTAASLTAGDGTTLDATGLQIPGVLDDLFSTSAALGPVFSEAGAPSLALWAPTAQDVKLLLYDDADPATEPAVVAMSADPSTGVWTAAGDASWDRKFYLYEVTVYSPATGRIEVNRVTDPYSLSLAADSTRSQIVRLNDADLQPVGWDDVPKPPLAAPEDIVLYELHVRDFSILEGHLPAAERGTFKAFARPQARGVRHLRELARAGLTHVHLLPAFDFVTVPERRADQESPGDLSGYPPDSEAPQAAIAAVQDADGFNWGYDPWHYTVPEGSYSTAPDGPGRIREFREMVAALNRLGLRVVMDVVYNHTNAAGQGDTSVLDRVVPGYYHRLNANGQVETSTCCANTASEHRMMEKLLIDSVLTWATVYKVDGFRFDLMGHHMKANLLALRAALDELTPAADGVDGAAIVLYGEGWNFGEVANDARGVNATQLNMAGTGIGTFSDRLRDAARGGNPFGGIQEQGFVNGLYTDPNGVPQGDELARLLLATDQIMVGLAGNLAAYPLENHFGEQVTGSEIDYNGQPAGYTRDPQEVITYVSAHDNETIFDAIQWKAPAAADLEQRVRMHNLALSLAGFGQGIPFFHAGDDLLRSKSLDRDSFNSGDWFNQIDWTGYTNNFGIGLPPAEKNQSNWDLMRPLLADPALRPIRDHLAAAKAHFREVLRIRRSSPLFRLRSETDVIARVKFHNTGPAQVPGVIVMSVSDEEGAVDPQIRKMVIVFNASDEAVDFQRDEFAGRALELHPTQRRSRDEIVRTATFDRGTGTFHVPARTTAVFAEER